MRFLASFVRFVDGLNDWIGRGVAWLVIPMVVITFLVATLRYGFSIGWVSMQESYMWLYGIIFMVGAGYTLLHGDMCASMCSIVRHRHATRHGSICSGRCF